MDGRSERLTIDEVSLYERDELMTYTSISNEDINVLRYNTILILKESGRLENADYDLVKYDIFQQIYVQDDDELLEVLSEIIDPGITVTRVEMIYLILAIRYSISEASWMLGNRSDTILIDYIPNTKEYVEGLIASGDLSRMTMTHIIHPDEELWNAITRFPVVNEAEISTITLNIMETGSMEEITALYNNLPISICDHIDIGVLKSRYPHLNILSFKDFIEYSEGFMTGDESRVLAIGLSKCNTSLLKVIETSDPSTYRAAGESRDPETVRSLLMEHRSDYEGVYTEILLGAIPGDISGVINVMDEYYGGDVWDIIDVARIIDRIVEVDAYLEDYLTQSQMKENYEAICDAILRHGADNFGAILFGTSSLGPRKYDSKDSERSYFLAVEGGSIKYVKAIRENWMDDNEALVIATVHNRIPVLKYILKVGNISQDTINNVLGMTDNQEIIDVVTQ